MVGRSEHAAVKNYLTPIRQVLSCVTKDVFLAHGVHTGAVHSAILGHGGRNPLRTPNPIYLHVAQQYRVVKVGVLRQYKVHCEAYTYALEDKESREIISFHWHPRSGYQNPHIHLGSGAGIGLSQLEKAHIPSGRIAVEDVVLCAIREFDVKPLREDWESVIEHHHAAFNKYRTWG